jgi:hypothetical protein
MLVVVQAGGPGGLDVFAPGLSGLALTAVRCCERWQRHGVSVAVYAGLACKCVLQRSLCAPVPMLCPGDALHGGCVELV